MVTTKTATPTLFLEKWPFLGFFWNTKKFKFVLKVDIQIWSWSGIINKSMFKIRSKNRRKKGCKNRKKSKKNIEKIAKRGSFLGKKHPKTPIFGVFKKNFCGVYWRFLKKGLKRQKKHEKNEKCISFLHKWY